MIERDEQRADIEGILNGARAGHYTLPDDVTAAAEGFASVERLAKRIASQAEPISDHALAEALGIELVALVESGDDDVPVSFLDRLEAAQRERMRLDFARRVTAIARRDAWQRLKGTVMDLVDVILAEHLHPAMTALMADIAALAPSLDSIDVTNPEALIGRPKAAQDAYLALTAASTRNNAIRDAQRHCYAFGEPESGARYTELQNLRAVWGDRWRGEYQSSWRPWPAQPLQRLIWLATSEAKPWVPTPEQADEVARQVRAAETGTVSLRRYRETFVNTAPPQS